jgi:hypothetical protein
MSIQYTNDAASGWGGDSVALLTKGEGHLLHLVTVWDSEEEAEEFERTMDLVAESVIAPSLAELAGEGGVHGVRLLTGKSARERVFVSWAMPNAWEGEVEALIDALRWTVVEDE